MNGTAQRQHRTVTQSLESRVEALETLTVQMSHNCDYLKAQLDDHDTRMRHLETANWQATEFRFHSSFSARLRWFLLGR